MITYNLAPQPNWRFYYPADWADTTLANTPLVDGQIYTYESTAHTTPKSTWVDPAGVTLQTNPIILDANGEPEHPIYWKLDDSDHTDLYYIEVRSPATLASPTGTLIYAFDKFDGSALFPLGENATAETQNYLSNAQFRFWSSDDAITVTAATSTLTADNWYFKKDVGDGTQIITRTSNATSLTIDGFYPTPYAYNCNVTNFGSSSYVAVAAQQIQDVYTLNGVEVTLTFFAKVASGSTTFNITVIQNFGTGGSATVTTSFAITGSVNTFASQYSVTFTVPSITGKTVATDGTDYIEFQIRNTTQSSFNLTLNEPQIQIGSSANNFQYNDSFQDTAQMLPSLLGFQTGWMLHGQLLSSIPGWVILQDGTIGNSSSNASARANTDCYNLFALIWNTFNEFTCPVFTSAGLLIAKATDANALAAWTANRAISVPRLASRSIGATGIGFIDSIVTFSSSSGLLATLTSVGATNTNLIYTGTQISFLANGATLPTGITDSTTYYAIYNGTTTLKIATSFANAIAGTAIAYTDSGSGTIRFHSGFSSRSLGVMVGQESHVQLAAEVGAHIHGENTSDGNNPDVIKPLVTINNAGSVTGVYINAASLTGSASKAQISTQLNEQTTGFNVMQPTLFLNSFIKL